MQKRLLYHFINDDELLRISHKIKEIEKKTTGKICVTIREHRHFLSKKKSVEELAQAEFMRLGIGNTQDKTGILIFILLEGRQFYILTGSGIKEKAHQNTWNEIKEQMQNMFINGEFGKGIIHGIDMIGNVLTLHFPSNPDDNYTISDKVQIED
ncbi:MAG: TPM domain-containing protein [Ignavibacteriaceae bacterium]|jgi:uncharacterized membrane protein